MFSFQDQTITAVPTVKNVSAPSSSSATALHEIYIKYQGVEDFLTVPSENFQYIPDLNEAFHITQNTLFRITFQGGVYNNGQLVDQLVHIMVNGYLIIADKILPNTAARVNYGLGNTLYDVDAIGGHYGAGYPTRMHVTRVAHVLLSPGTWTFNVGTRSVVGEKTGIIHRSMVTYELTQFQDPNLASVGGLSMAQFPK